MPNIQNIQITRKTTPGSLFFVSANAKPNHQLGNLLGSVGSTQRKRAKPGRLVKKFSPAELRFVAQNKQNRLYLSKPFHGFAKKKPRKKRLQIVIAQNISKFHQQNQGFPSPGTAQTAGFCPTHHTILEPKCHGAFLNPCRPQSGPLRTPASSL